MAMAMLSDTDVPNKAEFLSVAKESIERAITETRTLSHLLHPPLLDEAGFVSAARLYVEGFGKRNGIEARLDLPSTADRLPESIELALFRILQESLTNVHRHSGSSSVEIRLEISDRQAKLTVRDFGHGMPVDLRDGLAEGHTRLGVGLSGM
jgi:signal transduction histidine kinase